MTIKLKYPIILVHGLAVKDKRVFWGRIPKRLQEAGLNVYPGKTDSWGSFESNAHLLAKTIDEVLALHQCEKVNIIAHSKGGIDSRFLISSLGYAGKVAGLTTIATPHHGSEIVDFILERRAIYSPKAKQIINSLVKVYGDKSPDPYRIAAELSTEGMKEFNRNNPDHPGVRYSSYHSILKDSLDDLYCSYTFNFLRKIAGENDGIVSLKSARWGTDFTLIEGLKKSGISHLDIIDLKRKKVSGLDIPAQYLKIVEKLMERGC
jgi:Predicted acetyltransferases and hydrolases with the alpha/beta hydrolase fold